MGYWRNAGVRIFRFKLNGEPYVVGPDACVSVPDVWDYAILEMNKHSGADFVCIPESLYLESELDLAAIADALGVDPASIETAPKEAINVEDKPKRSTKRKAK